MPDATRCAACNGLLADSAIPWRICPYCGADPATGSGARPPSNDAPPPDRPYHRTWGLIAFVGGIAGAFVLGWFYSWYRLQGGSFPRFGAFVLLGMAACVGAAGHGFLRLVTGRHVSIVGSESHDERDS